MADTEKIEVVDESTEKERAAVPFQLTRELKNFSDLVVSQTVPVKKDHWLRTVSRNWNKVRVGFSDKAASTQKLYISKFRVAVRNALEAAESDNGRAIEIFNKVKNDILIFEDELMAEITKADKARIKRYSTSLSVFPEWELVLSEFRILLHHSQPELIALGLLAVTGRRMSEVLSAGTFGPVTSRLETDVVRGTVTQRYKVGFHGQMKTRKAERTKFDKWYNIPVLAEGREVLDAVKRLHATDKGAEWAQQNSAELNNTANTPLNRALWARPSIITNWPKEEIEATERGRRLSLKFLRAFYAEVSFHYFAKPNETKHAFFHKVLGHGDDDYQSSLSYMRYALGKTVTPQYRKELKELEKQLRDNREAYQAKDSDKNEDT